MHNTCSTYRGYLVLIIEDRSGQLINNGIRQKLQIQFQAHSVPCQLEGVDINPCPVEAEYDLNNFNVQRI